MAGISLVAYFPLGCMLKLSIHLEHYGKWKDWSKMVSKVFFLFLMAFLMQIYVGQKKSSHIFFYSPPYRSMGPWAGMSDMSNGLPIQQHQLIFLQYFTTKTTPTIFPFNILPQKQHQRYFPSIFLPQKQHQ